MRRKHFSALAAVILLLLVLNFGGVFQFLNSWAFDHVVRLGPETPVASDIVAIRVGPETDLEALVASVKDLDCRSLSMLMLNHSGTLTSFIFSPEGEVLKFKSEVRPPDSLIWRGPEDAAALGTKLSSILTTPVEVGEDVRLDFAHRSREIPFLEAHQVVTHDYEEGFFTDKIVIIGDHFSSQSRFFSTPIHQGGNALTSLAREVLLIDCALRDGWVKVIPAKASLLLALIIITGLVVVNSKLPGEIRFKRLTFVLAASFSVASLMLLKIGQIWFPPAEILFSICVTGLILYIATYHELKNTLSKVLNHVIEKPTCGVVVYGAAGKLKYYSEDSDVFLSEQFGIELFGKSRDQFLSELGRIELSEAEKWFRTAGKKKYQEKGYAMAPREVGEKTYDVTVRMLDTESLPEESDYLISIKDISDTPQPVVSTESERTVLSHVLPHPERWYQFLSKEKV